MKQKKKTVILLTLVLAMVVTCGVVYAMQEIAEISAETELLTQAQESAENYFLKETVSDEDVSERFKLLDTEKISKLGEYNEDDVIRITEKYINYSVMFNMTAEENKYLISLVNSGYDCEKLLDIYAFMHYAKFELSDIKGIYEKGKKTDFYGKFWLEDAYEKHMGITPLTEKDIAAYIHSGLSIDDILYAYKFGLGSDKTIHEILDMRKQEKTWTEILNEVQNCGIDGDIASVDENPEILYNIYVMSIKTNKELKNCVRKEGDSLILTDEAKTAFSGKVKTEKSVLEKQGYTKPMNEYVKEVVKKEFPDMSDDAVNVMIENGYRIKDIKNTIDKKDASQDIKGAEIQKYVETKQKERE